MSDDLTQDCTIRAEDLEEQRLETAKRMGDALKAGQRVLHVKPSEMTAKKNGGVLGYATFSTESQRTLQKLFEICSLPRSLDLMVLDADGVRELCEVLRMFMGEDRLNDFIDTLAQGPEPRQRHRIAYEQAYAHLSKDPQTSAAYYFPRLSDLKKEIHILEVSGSVESVGTVSPYRYAGGEFASNILLVGTEDWEKVRSGDIPLPEGWILAEAEVLCLQVPNE